MKHVTHKAPGFLLARLSLYLVGAAAAAAGVEGWREDTLTFSSVLFMTLTALSAIVVPANIEMVGRDRWSVLNLAPALIFGAINAYSFHHTVDVRIEAPREAEHHEVHVLPLQVVLTEAKAATKAAQAAVVAHVAPVIPETMGPKNTAARMAVWEAAHKPLTEALEFARAEQAKAEEAVKTAPAYEPMAPDYLVWIFAVGIDLAIALGIAGVANTRRNIQRRIEDREAKAERAEARRKEKAAETRRLARIEAQKKAAKDARKAPKQSAYTGPKLVSANDR